MDQLRCCIVVFVLAPLSPLAFPMNAGGTCRQVGDGLQHDADDGWKKRPHQITFGAFKIHEKKPCLCAFAIFAFTFPRFGPGSQEMEKCLDPKIEEASLLLG